MKNADIPLWDKGDNTDNFAKGGGGGFSREPMPSSEDKVKVLEEVYGKILGRKPTKKEIAYYKYRKLEAESLMQDLLESDEFLENIEKIKKFPVVEKELKKSKLLVTRLKANAADKDDEYSALKKLLLEKDSMILELRGSSKPFVTNKEDLNTTQYTNFITENHSSRDERKSADPVSVLLKRDGLIYRIIELFQRR